jgi:hypothetical protein|nr:MAG TPA: hypothetical protein [Caudoviricetes sp.]
MYIITFLPCGTQFLVNQENEDIAFKSAVKANELVGLLEDTNLADRNLYQIHKANFQVLIDLFQHSTYWGCTEDTIIFDE